MKRIALTIALFLCILSSQKAQAIEDLGGFVIDDFQVEIDVKADGTFLVQENIAVNFSEQRHGIFRKIPFKYKSEQGTNFNLRMNNFMVSDINGVSRVVAQEYKEDGNIVLKIGDPNAYVLGKQVYRISYEVENGIRFFDDHSELYWNPIGTQWPAEIKKATTIVNLHNNIVFSNNDLACFTSYYGSKESDCSIAVVSSDEVEFSASSWLQPYEGMTIAMRFPLNFVPKPEAKQTLLYLLADNWGFALPIVAFFVMFFLWFVHGKDPNLKKTTIVQYGPPENITPGELGYLIKERYSSNFVSADIVNLAVKGYLKISEVESTALAKKFQKVGNVVGVVIPVVLLVIVFFTFILSVINNDNSNGNDVGKIVSLVVFFVFVVMFLSSARRGLKMKKLLSNVSDYELQSTIDWRSDKSLTEHEKELLKGLFGFGNETKVKLSDLKNFYKNVQTASKNVRNQIDFLGYFENSRFNKKAGYVFAGAVLIFLGIILGSGVQRMDLFLGPTASGAIIMIFGILMSKKTARGAEVLRFSDGFKLYIHTAERYRVKFQEEEKIFEKILPYAMVFGLADKWAKAFEGIYNKNPEWYSSSTAHAFSPVSFASSLNNNFSAVSASVSSPPRSSSSSGFSGGGSSGGGGGGGGGGSW